MPSVGARHARERAAGAAMSGPLDRWPTHGHSLIGRTTAGSAQLENPCGPGQPLRQEAPHPAAFDGGSVPARFVSRMRKIRRMPSRAALISPTTMACPNSTHPGGAQGVTGNRHRFFDDHRQHGMDIQAARMFNTYGPRMHPNDGRVASNFIVQALKNEPITRYGDGTQSRAFGYVDDRIEGFVRLMDSSEGFTGPVNLGNPGEFTMIERAEAVRDLTGSRSELVHRPLPTDDPRQRQPDIRLAREHLGWEPRIPLREGLKPTIAYFERLLNEGFGKGRAVA